MDTASPPTLRTLLDRRDLRLRAIPSLGIADPALDHPVRWVHSSDLADPTPFLADDLVLLTTGTQMTDADSWSPYVARLAARGVVALGFGADVHRAGVPDELVRACGSHGLALFEVPYGTPFIAVARAHAEAIAAQAYARRTWALETQRALAIAALRPRGLESTLSELARRLGCWVGMFDAAGAIAHAHPAEADPPADIAAAARELIARGGSASRTIEHGEGAFTLFTLGRTGHLRGVIAIAAAALDSETRTVVTSVIAMAGLSLEQSDQLARSRRRLHTQLLASLLDDDPALARRVLGALPPAPVIVAVATGGHDTAVLEWWDRHRGASPAFVAESDEGVVMCVTEGDAPALDELARHAGVAVGASDPHEYASFSRAHAQALTALRRSPAGGRVARYGDEASATILESLATDAARLAAESRLSALRRHDALSVAADGSGGRGTRGGELERALRVWLEHDARLEPAAVALGVHRHTLRTRIAQAAELLGMDLAAFPARAELWTALRLSDPPA